MKNKKENLATKALRHKVTQRIIPLTEQLVSLGDLVSWWQRALKVRITYLQQGSSIIKKNKLSLYINLKYRKMELLADILKITIPALIVFLTAWLVLRYMIRNDQDKRRQELILQNSRTVTPIKLQAYERIILLLERISLESLLVRVSSTDMTAQQLHSTLLNTIRSEFEHNLSQQIYMSQQAWEVVRNARSNMIKIINSEAEKMPVNSSGMDLSKRLLERIMQLDKEPTRAAIDYVKNEIARIV